MWAICGCDVAYLHRIMPFFALWLFAKLACASEAPPRHRCHRSTGLPPSSAAHRSTRTSALSAQRPRHAAVTFAARALAPASPVIPCVLCPQDHSAIKPPSPPALTHCTSRHKSSVSVPLRIGRTDDQQPQLFRARRFERPRAACCSAPVVAGSAIANRILLRPHIGRRAEAIVHGDAAVVVGNGSAPSCRPRPRRPPCQSRRRSSGGGHLFCQKRARRLVLRGECAARIFGGKVRVHSEGRHCHACGLPQASAGSHARQTQAFDCAIPCISRARVRLATLTRLAQVGRAGTCVSLTFQRGSEHDDSYGFYQVNLTRGPLRASRPTAAPISPAAGLRGFQSVPQSNGNAPQRAVSERGLQQGQPARHLEYRAMVSLNQGSPPNREQLPFSSGLSSRSPMHASESIVVQSEASSLLEQLERVLRESDLRAQQAGFSTILTDFDKCVIKRPPGVV